MNDYASIIEFVTSYWSTCVVGAVLLILIYWYGTRSRSSLEKAFPGLSGPKQWPFIGTLPDVIRSGGQMHLQFDNDYKKYGKVFRTMFLDSPVVVVSDPAIIKDVFVKKFDCFHDRPLLFNKVPEPFDKGLDFAKGEMWRRNRSIASPTFSSHKLKAMVPLMNVRCDTLINKVEEYAKSGETFDIVKYQQALTLDVIMSSAFGIQTDYQKNPDDPVIKIVLKSMNPNFWEQMLVFFVLPMLPFGNAILNTDIFARFLFRDFYKVAEIARDVIAAKRKESTQKDFLDLLLQATSDDVSDKKKLTDDEVVAQCVLFIVAGYETTSFTLSMLTYSLATNPDVQEKLQQEIDSVWTDEDKMPSYDTVNDLPYLDMVVCETLRLYPAGFIHVRECTKECVIQGIKFPKNSVVFVPAYSMYRDPNLYPDPETFDPERFTAEAKQSRDPYLYHPFGIGPRNCIGMRFAHMEIKLVVVRLLKKYSFVKTPETKPPILEVKQTLTTAEVKIGVVKR